MVLTIRIKKSRLFKLSSICLGICFIFVPFLYYTIFYHPSSNIRQYEISMNTSEYEELNIQWNNNPRGVIVTLIRATNHSIARVIYIYRSSYEENSPALFPIEKLFINTTRPRTNCIYNNFFIIRLQWLYKSQRVLRFLHELVRDDLLLREYIGGGCIHAAMIDIGRQVKTEQLQQIRYGHNFHRMAPDDGGTFYKSIEEFEEEMRNSCDQIRIFNITNQIKRIKIE